MFWLSAMLWKARFPQHREAVEGVVPTLDGAPFPGQVPEGQLHHFQGGILRGICAGRLDGLAQALHQ